MGKMKVTPIDEVSWGLYAWQMPDESLVMDDEGCLLYTSPSPRDRTRSRMPSSA